MSARLRPTTPRFASEPTYVMNILSQVHGSPRKYPAAMSSKARARSSGSLILASIASTPPSCTHDGSDWYRPDAPAV